MEDREKKVLSRLQALCSKRECCTKMVMEKAMKYLDGDEVAAREVVEALVKDKYLDDKRFAAAFVREKTLISGWGPLKISSALSAKGIPREMIIGALRGNDVTEAEVSEEESSAVIKKVLGSKYRQLVSGVDVASLGYEEKYALKTKLLRFALSRGWTYDSVASVVDLLFASE